VLDAARGSERIAAVVCLTPFVPGRETQRSARTPLLRLAAAAAGDRLRMLLRREPRGVAVGGSPGEAAILVREDAATRERAMLPADARVDPSGDRAELADGSVWENRVVLRPRLRNPNPLRIASEVGCPLLVVAGSEDVLCPPGPAAELARRAPSGELEILECGHFDLYEGRSIAAEADFLGRNLRRSAR
jgi:pimeloyl-ACP methyl ester carboxylesterase